jgi:protein-serine/threonine kinase
MAFPLCRPLPTPPTAVRSSQNQRIGLLATDMHESSHPYPRPNDLHNELPTTTLPGGTMLHQGFYDLLAMIPTPSPSRLFWGAGWNQQPVVAGPRYEDISPNRSNVGVSKPAPPISAPVPFKKGRRISKDMVSKPTGFVCVTTIRCSLCNWFDAFSSHLVHASDADQAEALLTRWGPDGLGKLGGQDLRYCEFQTLRLDLDPRWANPIIDRIRQKNQEKAVNEVVNALKPSQDNKLDGPYPPLQVVNGLSTTTSSALTTAAQENFGLLPADGLPGHLCDSAVQRIGVLKSHREENTVSENQDYLPVSPPRKPIIPSLSTLERAVSARIYFENLYFPLLRHPPSREQRRVAMEKDMMDMQLNDAHKENLRARWRQNETDYLRDRRRKVDPSAFIKLKTIGHGLHSSQFGFNLSKLIFLDYFLRRIWRCFPGERKAYWSSICYETGIPLESGFIDTN